MNAVEQTTLWYQDLIQQQEHTSALDEVTWMRDIRQQARNSFLHSGFPDRKQEAWRYSNIERILKKPFTPAQPAFAKSLEANINSIIIDKMDAYRLVFADNGFREDLSDLKSLPDGLLVQSLKSSLLKSPELMQHYFDRGATHQYDAFAALNTTLMADGLFIYVNGGVGIDKPVEIIYFNSTQNSQVSSSPRVIIAMQPGSQLTLIERFMGSGNFPYFHNMVENIFLNCQSSLSHYRLIEENHSAFHLSNIFVQQSEQSHYHAMNLDLDGAWMRTNYQVDLVGRYGECQLDGLYMVDDNQQSNIHTDVRHHEPDCVSRQNYKGLLFGKGRAVFDGRIIVDPDAQRTDAHLSNGNLMLSDQAEVDIKPQLEIYADNVKCSHGTTVGELDPEQIYYLRSRGVDEAGAYNMLCQGFVSEVLEACEVDELHHYALSRTARSLSRNLRY